MIINISRLEEIVGDDVELKKSLIELFLETFSRVIADLNSNNRTWEAAIHELKGAALNMGFEDLGIYCRKIESFDGSELEKQEILERLKNIQTEVIIFLKNL